MFAAQVGLCMYKKSPGCRLPPLGGAARPDKHDNSTHSVGMGGQNTHCGGALAITRARTTLPRSH
jgi:hypothetical protein